MANLVSLPRSSSAAAAVSSFWFDAGTTGVSPWCAYSAAEPSPTTMQLCAGAAEATGATACSMARTGTRAVVNPGTRRADSSGVAGVEGEGASPSPGSDASAEPIAQPMAPSTAAAPRHTTANTRRIRLRRRPWRFRTTRAAEGSAPRSGSPPGPSVGPGRDGASEPIQPARRRRCSARRTRCPRAVTARSADG